MDTRIFPTILIILDILAAVVYWSDGDIRRVFYWIAAGVITASVTY